MIHLNSYVAYLSIFLIFFSSNLNSQKTIALPLSEEARVRYYDGTPDPKNFGDTKYIIAYAGTNRGKVAVQRTYMSFDISDIPSNADIINAELYLKTEKQAPAWIDGHRKTGENISTIHHVLEPWDENTIHWSNQPNYSEDNYILVPESTSKYQDYSIDITDFIADMLMEPSRYHGFLLKLLHEQPYRTLAFASSHHPNEDLHPYLLVSYKEQNTARSTRQSFDDQDIFSLSLKDVSIVNGKIFVFNSNGALVLNEEYTQSRTFTISQGDLAKGRYFYQVISGQDNIASGVFVVPE